MGIERRVVDLAVQRAGGRPVPKDRLIGDLAGRQYGVVSRPQLLAMGIGAGAIQTRVRKHYLHRLHRGVYAVGHLALVPLAREMVAVLACGPRAAISHRSSAVVWYMLPAIDDADIDVTVLTGKGRRAGLQIHQTTRLSPQDIRHLRGLPVTTPSRTVIDLAECVTDRELERALHEAITRRLLNAHRLRAELVQYRGRRGISRLRKLLENADPLTLTRSQAEERFLALVRAAGLPAPEVNARILGHEVDFLWRDEAARRGGRRLPVPLNTRRLRARSTTRRRTSRSRAARFARDVAPGRRCAVRGADEPGPSARRLGRPSARKMVL